MRRSGLIWLQSDDPPRRRALWHAWVEDTAYLLTGGGEQPDPGLGTGEAVHVVVRSKDTEQRLVVFTARASRLLPDNKDWETATAELAKKRLNLHDAAHAPHRWASQDGYTLYRLEPTGEITEGPGNYSDRSLRAAPVDTVATTINRRR